MEIIDRMGHMRDQVRKHRLESEMDDVRRDNLRLKARSSVLHDVLKEDRSDIVRLFSIIERLSGARSPQHRSRRIVMLAAVATGGYVMGAKAGRQRYDDIRDALRRATRNAYSVFGGVRARADHAVDEAQAVAGRISDAGQVIGDAVRAVAEGPVNVDANPRSSSASASA